jgi:hypothetical protein
MACVAFLMSVTSYALGAPWWAMAGLALVWVAGLVLALRWFTRRPRTVVVLPVAVALVWLVTVLSGVRWLGWLDA